jgi:DNA polymerase
MKNLYNTLLLKQLYQLKNIGFNYTDSQTFFSKKKESSQLPNTLLKLKKQVINCHLCSLSKSRREVVFGEGYHNADVMFIGDIPLEIEDKRGRIALGYAGEMLIKMIEKVLKIPRHQVYITNLLKCYPVSTQKVKETEFHTCKAYLFKEIELIKPKVIITLGEKTYHYLTNDSKPLKEKRGIAIKREDYHIIPTYHPNFLLKNPSFKKEVFQDLKKVIELLS